MKISFNWLKDHVSVDMDVKDISRILTDTGLEVEGVHDYSSISGSLEGIVVGHITHIEKHPDADRLKLTKVDVGEAEELDIVCGAPNVALGQKVAVATVGAVLSPIEGESFKIKKSKIRGAVSEGMLCAEDELGLGKGHDGIMVLDETLEVGTALEKVISIYTDKVIEIGLTPNRMDAISHRGVARDLVAYLNLGEAMNLTERPYDIPKASGSRARVTLLDNEGCSRYSGIELSGIEVGPSPEWLTNRLKVIGLNPINNIVDITNYVMHDIGQPLHAFDLDKIKGERIYVRRAVNAEAFITLDDTERKLDEADLLICDEKEPMCIAGVFGGAKSGVTESTRSIFLESAAFDSVSIRKTAKRHQLSTDSSFRFERGVDPNGTIDALAMAISLMVEHCGAKVSSELVDIYPSKLNPLEIDLDLDYAERLMGVKIPEDRMTKILESLDFQIKLKGEKHWTMDVPTYRMDVTRQADVVEELLRIHGFNQVPLPGKISHSITDIDRTVDEGFKSSTSRFLTGRGYSEMMNNSLTSMKARDLLSEKEQGASIKMLNPLSQDLAVLRQRMLWGALDAVAYNVNRQSKDLAFFEFGNTYFRGEEGFGQKACLSLTTTGSRFSENWDRPSEKVSFYDLKAQVDDLLSKVVALGNIELMTTSSDLLSQAIQYNINGENLAILGQVDKKVAKRFDVKQEVYHAELNWGLMSTLKASKAFKLQEIPRFPAVRKDLSLLLDKSLTFMDLEKLAMSTGGKLLKEVKLFDVYEGKNLPEGKVSYALGFLLQDEKSTLTDKVVEKMMKRIQSAFEKEFKAELRQ